MRQIIRVGVLYLSRIEIDNYDDSINMGFDSDKNLAKVFDNTNFLSICINIINNTLKSEVEIEILKEEGEND